MFGVEDMTPNSDLSFFPFVRLVHGSRPEAFRFLLKRRPGSYLSRPLAAARIVCRFADG